MVRIFPFVLILLDVAAGVVYIFARDWRKSIYWFAAATLTITVTF